MSAFRMTAVKKKSLGSPGLTRCHLEKWKRTEVPRVQTQKSLVGATAASGEEIVDSVPVVEVEIPPPSAVGHHTRAALVALDAVDLTGIF